MGFKASKRRSFEIEFDEDTDFPGLAVKVTAPKFGDWVALLRGELQDEEGEEVTEDDLFISCVVSWNLEDDEDNVLPISVESFHTLDIAAMFQLKRKWIRATQDISDDLKKELPSGGQSPEVSIPMETL